MAELANFEVTIVDPRGSFASDARFPGVKLMDEWPDEALIKLAPDTRTGCNTYPRPKTGRSGIGRGVKDGCILYRFTWKQKDAFETIRAPSGSGF